MHPVTAAMLVEIGWFPSLDKARKRLRRLVQRNRIRLVGTVCRKTGRPEHVFCRWHPKVDQMLHEIGLTELCFRIHAGTILRGPQVTDREILPDAEVWINGACYYLELDRGTMSYEQIVRTRFRKYEGCPQFLLEVCPSEARMEGLRQRAEKIQHIALFTTRAAFLADPHGEIWRDFKGESASLPREGA
jgi:hypothetical protein